MSAALSTTLLWVALLGWLEAGTTLSLVRKRWAWFLGLLVPVPLWWELCHWAFRVPPGTLWSYLMDPSVKAWVATIWLLWICLQGVASWVVFRAERDAPWLQAVVFLPSLGFLVALVPVPFLLYAWFPAVSGFGLSLAGTALLSLSLALVAWWLRSVAKDARSRVTIRLVLLFAQWLLLQGPPN